jgi:endonuclease-3
MKKPRRRRMTPAVRAARIGDQLDELFPRPAIPLDHEDPYTLLVSVVLSAQCSDARVNQTAPLLYERAARPAEMVRLTPADIERIIRPCGLAPAKSKNIHRLSQILIDRHGGEVPQSFEELEALPGVGHKTASVVMAQAFGVPAFPVDTHIHRLAGRWRLSRARNVAEVERDLKRLYPPERWADRHLQIIYFGREYCPARGHDPAGCPICSWAS